MNSVRAFLRRYGLAVLEALATGGVSLFRSRRPDDDRNEQSSSVWDAADWLYLMELVVTGALLVLLVALGWFVGWAACIGAFVAFLLGMGFAIVSHFRRDVHLMLVERDER